MMKMESNNITKKGTTTLGIVCKDGLVLAADKRATAGNFVANKKVEKIYAVTDDIALTMAGTVSDAQLLSKLLKAEVSLKSIRTSMKPCIKEVANLLGGMVYANIRKMSMVPGISHFVLGGKDDSGFYIYEVYADGSVTKCDDFISSGSGSVMAYGVLETLYKPGITVDEAVKLAVKSINAALQRDTATGNGIDVVSITSQGVKKVLEKELNMRIEL